MFPRSGMGQGIFRFKCDENLPSEATALLLGAGHDAHSVLDKQMGGAPDSALARVCQDESRFFFTLDLDFANIRNYPPPAAPSSRQLDSTAPYTSVC